MEVFVRTAAASMLSFEVEASESLLSLKGRIEVATGVPMNRQRLTLLGDEPEELTVMTAVARAAARDCRLGTKAMLDLMRREGMVAVNSLVQESRTFNMLEQDQPSYFLQLRLLKDQGITSSCSSLTTTAASSSSSSISSEQRTSLNKGSTLGRALVLDSPSVRSEASEIPKPSCSLSDLTIENHLRAAKLRLLMSERRLRFR